MSRFIDTNGTSYQVNPRGGRKWTASELQRLVRGLYMIRTTTDGNFMVVNQMGTQERYGLLLNDLATRLSNHEDIRGPVVIVRSLAEIPGRPIVEPPLQGFVTFAELQAMLTNYLLLSGGELTGTLIVPKIIAGYLGGVNPPTNAIIAAAGAFIGTEPETIQFGQMMAPTGSGNGYLQGIRVPATHYSNLFMGGSISQNSDGTFTAHSDGGSNFWAAIMMDNWGGNNGAISFFGSSDYAGGSSAYTLDWNAMEAHRTATLSSEGNLVLKGNLLSANIVAKPDNGTYPYTADEEGACVLGWNATNGNGESDFINIRGYGGGGFNWFNVQQGETVNSTTAPLMWIDSSSVLHVHDVMFDITVPLSLEARHHGGVRPEGGSARRPIPRKSLMEELGQMASKDYVSTAIAGIPTVDISHLAAKDWVTQQLSPKVTRQELTSAVEPLATREFVEQEFEESRDPEVWMSREQFAEEAKTMQMTFTRMVDFLDVFKRVTHCPETGTYTLLVKDGQFEWVPA